MPEGSGARASVTPRLRSTRCVGFSRWASLRAALAACRRPTCGCMRMITSHIQCSRCKGAASTRFRASASASQYCSLLKRATSMVRLSILRHLPRVSATSLDCMQMPCFRMETTSCCMAAFVARSMISCVHSTSSPRPPSRPKSRRRASCQRPDCQSSRAEKRPELTASARWRTLSAMMMLKNSCGYFEPPRPSVSPPLNCWKSWLKEVQEW
mmetsp:Transcript_79142/g.245641  ORF Transcript_79142/g.245641 Transcript_79142/m.245641 type:complete len:212 (-) Transcript_79142:80-715(-)